MKNRILKFRAWDTESKCWIQPSILEVFSDDGVLRSLYDYEGLHTIIQQSSGLFDKNDKEAYEGDIFSDGNVSYLLKFGRHTDGKNDFYGYYTPCSDISQIKHGICVRKSELIGNIFENPELLEK